VILGRAALLERVQAVPKPSLMSWLGVAGVMATLVVLSLHEIQAKGYWFDEAMSLDYARRPWDDFVAVLTGSELNGSLYYLVLRAWRLLGEGETRVRFLSILFMAGTVPMLYLVGVRYVGAAGALLGCAIFALSAFVVEYAQEARMYAMGVFLASAAVFAWTRGAETSSARWWAVYAVLISASLYVHFFCGFLLLALTLLLVVGRAPRTRAAILAHVIAAAAALPIALFVLTPRGNIDWIPPTTPARAADVLVQLAGGSVALALVVYGGAAMGIIGRRREELWRLLPIILWFAVPVALGLVAATWKPMLITRYFIVAVPAVALLAGAGMARLAVTIGTRRLPMAVPAMVLVAALSAGPLADWYERPRTDWRGAADWVQRTALSDDRILFLGRHSPIDRNGVYRGRVPFLLYLERADVFLTVASVTEVIERPQRTWLVLHWVRDLAYKDLREQMSGYDVEVSKLFEGVRVQLLVPVDE
jgi:mannosyltransferase